MAISVASLVLLAAAASAAPYGQYGQQQNMPWTLSVSETPSTEYIWRGVGESKNGFLTDLDVKYDWQHWLKAKVDWSNWTSISSKGFAGRGVQGNALDLGLEAARKEWPVSVGVGWVYDMGQINRNLRTLYATVDASPAAKLPFRLGASLAWDYRGPAVMYYAKLEAGKTWKLDKKWSVDADGWYGHGFTHAGDAMGEFAVRGSAKYQLTKRVAITPLVQVDAPGHLYGESRRFLSDEAVQASYTVHF
jgi:hypothetical protein